MRQGFQGDSMGLRLEGTRKPEPSPFQEIRGSHLTLTCIPPENLRRLPQSWKVGMRRWDEKGGTQLSVRRQDQLYKLGI